MPKNEVFISIDIETSGPVPEQHSMLSIGACYINRPEITFECYLKPTTLNVDPKALAITGLSLDLLADSGETPEVAMSLFNDWILGSLEPQDTPIFVGLNAPFDWSFINYYFYRYFGSNPFGFSALDIKALYMGKYGTTWQQTRSSEIAKRLSIEQTGNHNALQDALYQAELFRNIMSK